MRDNRTASVVDSVATKRLRPTSLSIFIASVSGDARRVGHLAPLALIGLLAEVHPTSHCMYARLVDGLNAVQCYAYCKCSLYCSAVQEEDRQGLTRLTSWQQHWFKSSNEHPTPVPR
jgi:hypothetical protein